MTRVQDDCRVAVVRGSSTYPATVPYSPTTRYPEYPFAGDEQEGEGHAQPPNDVYEGTREAFRLLGLDDERFGTSQWNPLAEWIRPGDTVVLKPNFIRDFRETREGHDDCLITHGAVIRAVLDYVLIALGGSGRVVIADAPQNDADFEDIRRIACLDEIAAFYRRRASPVPEVIDLRPEAAEKVDGVIVGHRVLPGDPAGYTRVDLGGRSAFREVEHLAHLLYGAEYDTAELRRHHANGAHEYLIARTVLEADCVINLPKLKTHKKTGLTVCLKNLVGINGNKNWLPHHREGTPSEGGDQFAEDGLRKRVERRSVERFKRFFPLLGPIRPLVAGRIKAVGKRVFGDTNTNTIRSGNWYGNDTTWRMVLDLNRILFFADAEGRVHDRPVRRLLNVVDGVVGGEGNGPLDPVPKPVGVIVAGHNPVAVDLVCARWMGFDWRRVPLLRRGVESHALPLIRCDVGDVVCISSDPATSCALPDLNPLSEAFRPHFGWEGHIEIEPTHAGVRPGEAS